MEEFIQQTVKKIIGDLNENMEVTIAIKVDEKTKVIKDSMKALVEENVTLKKDIIQLKSQMANM